MGVKRGYYAVVFLYVSAFIFSNSWLNNRKRLNINYLVNARDFNGEIFLNLVMKYYPHKVNTEKFRQILLEKYENQLYRINDMEGEVLKKP